MIPKADDEVRVLPLDYPSIYSAAMQADIDRVLIPQERIARRVGELAAEITGDHATGGPGGSEITLIPIMTGAMVFCADLLRRIPLAVRVSLLTVSSYPGASVQSVGAKMMSQLGDVGGRRVVLIDDILDTGGTLKLVQAMLREGGVASLRTCVLLRKDRPRPTPVEVDYVGFDIPDEFVVGYGLDFDNYYRNLPDIVTLKPHVVGAAGAGLQ